MQIVIDIPESIMGHLKDGSFGARIKDKAILVNAVMNGTPLPKGHGKIVDTRLAYQNTMQYSDKTRKMIMKVIDASVILEADKDGDRNGMQMADDQ